ncbi:hypothetical protein F5Y14DRAFT_200184 [Nemania sp. NC0429]|nr:hypothetical protein F5Y14DRAFT_200184 [Nemania sp. NC0429]
MSSQGQGISDIHQVALFDERDEAGLRRWRRKHEENRRRGIPAQTQAQDPPSQEQRERAQAAERKFLSIRTYVELFLEEDYPAFDDFLTRLSEFVYGIRENTASDIHVMLRNAAESGWPRVEIWTRHPTSPPVVSELTVRTRWMIVRMVEAGALELPARAWFRWQLCDAGGTSEINHEWGDGPGHFGNLDLWECLDRFPLCALDLGWFQKPTMATPLDPALVKSYQQSQGPQGPPLLWEQP